MNTTKVQGRNQKHKVLMYTLSTCAWCKMVKRFLKNKNVEYEYVDVDLCSDDDSENIRNDILDRGGRLSYPVIIIDNKELMNGFYEDKLRVALEI
jgi:glutaredoxin